MVGHVTLNNIIFSIFLKKSKITEVKIHECSRFEGRKVEKLIFDPT